MTETAFGEVVKDPECRFLSRAKEGEMRFYAPWSCLGPVYAFASKEEYDAFQAAHIARLAKSGVFTLILALTPPVLMSEFLLGLVDEDFAPSRGLIALIMMGLALSGVLFSETVRFRLLRPFPRLKERKQRRAVFACSTALPWLILLETVFLSLLWGAAEGWISPGFAGLLSVPAILAGYMIAALSHAKKRTGVRV